MGRLETKTGGKLGPIATPDLRG